MKIRFLLCMCLFSFMFSNVGEARHVHGIHHHHGHHLRHGHHFHYGNLYGWGYFRRWYPVGFSYYPYYRSLRRFHRRYTSFAAISYSPATQKFGVAWGNRSRGQAQKNANGYCGEKDCKPVVWVRGGCAAIAKSDKSDKVGWGYHTSKHRARSYAIRGCKQNAEEGCKVLAWACSR